VEALEKRAIYFPCLQPNLHSSVFQPASWDVTVG
jgi:hypothetical protein